MPLTPSKIKTMTYPTHFEYMGETVNLSYYPTAIRNTSQTELEAWQAHAQAATEAEQDTVLVEFGGWVCKILASWDFVESVNDDGTPGPMMAITPENIAAVSQSCGDFMLRVIEAIFVDFKAKNETGTAS